VSPSDADAADRPSEHVRLQKALATGGIASRRASERLVAEGRVTVDGVLATLGATIDTATAVVRVDGRRVNLHPDMVYLAMNKPTGVLSAMSDARGRPTVADYVADRDVRLFHVGRLDVDTEGLLILSNDGDFANRLAHPSYEVLKTYVAEVSGAVSQRALRSLRSGVDLEDGPARADSVRVLDTSGDRALVELALHEGRNRIVRRMLAEVGHPVSKLVRVSIGPVKLGDLRTGTLRELNQRELGELYGELGL
jgi:23S rRNA pseudouridine2605 synthase